MFDEPAVTVLADPGRLEQALSNLVSNAIRFTPAGGQVTVSTHALPTGGTRLDVSDTGVGLSSEEQARVFDRFYKQDASRSRTGTGLGLSIVRAIAEAHGGLATVRSTPGSGSTFSVTPAGPARAMLSPCYLPASCVPVLLCSCIKKAPRPRKESRGAT